MYTKRELMDKVDGAQGPTGAFMCYHSMYDTDRRAGPYDYDGWAGVNTMLLNDKADKKYPRVLNKHSGRHGSGMRFSLRHDDEYTMDLARLVHQDAEARLLCGCGRVQPWPLEWTLSYTCAGMPQKHLERICKHRGIRWTGSKDELATRLHQHDRGEDVPMAGQRKRRKQPPAQPVGGDL